MAKLIQLSHKESFWSQLYLFIEMFNLQALSYLNKIIKHLIYFIKSNYNEKNKYNIKKQTYKQILFGKIPKFKIYIGQYTG